MFNLTPVIEKLITDTGYDVSFARAKEPSFANENDPPRLFVGYHAILSLGHLGEGESPDPYMAFAEDLSQSFQTQILCSVADLPVTWHNVYNSLHGWMPLTVEKEYSGIFYSNGGVMGLNNGRIWWLDNWRMDFPRANPMPGLIG